MFRAVFIEDKARSAAEEKIQFDLKISNCRRVNYKIMSVMG